MIKLPIKSSLSMNRIFILASFIFFLNYPLYLQAQAVSKYIVVDQFGYRTDAKKVAIIRDPKTGFDQAESFTPGATYQLINKTTSLSVFTGSCVEWKAGVTDVASGDKAWRFDFSSVTTVGSYYVLDVSNNVRSYEFKIEEDIYREVLKQAVRTFFYQRAGFEKKAVYAGAAWADGASHIKNLQDKNARQYNLKNDVNTEIDLSGGWYDAGDYNKYTSWTANYVVGFMYAYLEKPGAWGDDYNIPESGNKIPDILDEAKWGIDHLLRLQRTDGSVLSIVGLAEASPPSSATGQSLYGKANTSSTLNAAAAYALSSKVYAGIGMKEYSDRLKVAAIKAWDWAVANPSVIFKNNDNASGTSGLGAGQQETDNFGRLVAKLRAACFLFELTGDAAYRTYFDANYTQMILVSSTFAFPFALESQETLLYYAALPNATPSSASNINSKYKLAMNDAENFAAFYADKDPYQAHIKDYTWGSNSTKSSMALMFLDMITYQIDASKNIDSKIAAEGFVHYLHGVNPLNMVYLSNMYAYGADNGVNEFYHAWYANGSTKWDRVGTSTYGPAPGFLTGGPNPSYEVDTCCPSGCGGSNALCTSETLTPPKGQPAQKSYKDFNTAWPLNSWSATENSNGYQINYIRMLSHFVRTNYDCSGTENGTATRDVCSNCTGGTTGVTAITDASKCLIVTSISPNESLEIQIFPNPTQNSITIVNPYKSSYKVSVTNSIGKNIIDEIHTGNATILLSDYPPGVYVVMLVQKEGEVLRKVIKF